MTIAIPTARDFRKLLNDLFKRAEEKGMTSVTIRSGTLHRHVGGYPGTNHRMPVCCDVMYSLMNDRDRVLQSPPKGKGANLVIEYELPRR